MQIKERTLKSTTITQIVEANYYGEKLMELLEQLNPEDRLELLNYRVYWRSVDKTVPFYQQEFCHDAEELAKALGLLKYEDRLELCGLADKENRRFEEVENSSLFLRHTLFIDYFQRCHGDIAPLKKVFKDADFIRLITSSAKNASSYLDCQSGEMQVKIVVAEGGRVIPKCYNFHNYSNDRIVGFLKALPKSERAKALSSKNEKGRTVLDEMNNMVHDYYHQAAIEENDFGDPWRNGRENPEYATRLKKLARIEKAYVEEAIRLANSKTIK